MIISEAQPYAERTSSSSQGILVSATNYQLRYSNFIDLPYLMLVIVNKISLTLTH